MKIGSHFRFHRNGYRAEEQSSILIKWLTITAWCPSSYLSYFFIAFHNPIFFILHQRNVNKHKIPSFHRIEMNLFAIFVFKLIILDFVFVIYKHLQWKWTFHGIHLKTKTTWIYMYVPRILNEECFFWKFIWAGHHFYLFFEMIFCLALKRNKDIDYQSSNMQKKFEHEADFIPRLVKTSNRRRNWKWMHEKKSKSLISSRIWPNAQATIIL